MYSSAGSSDKGHEFREMGQWDRREKERGTARGAENGMGTGCRDWNTVLKEEIA